MPIFKLIATKTRPLEPERSPAGVVAFIWVQCENDCFEEERAQAYAGLLEKLIKAVRDKVGNQNLPILIGGINPWAVSLPYGQTVKQAQIDVAKKIPGVILVEKDPMLTSKFYHEDFWSHVVTGAKLARALTEQLKLQLKAQQKAQQGPHKR